MTKSFQDAFTVVSMSFSPKEQERFAHLIIENIGRLRNFLEEESEERNFDRIAIEITKSEKIHRLFGKVADRYKDKSSGNHL